MDGGGDNKREEMDKALNSTFVESANTLSHFYSNFLSMQDQLFKAGEKHSMEKVRRWLFAKLQQGDSVTVQDIREYLQKELRLLELKMASETCVSSGLQVGQDLNIPLSASGQSSGSQGSSSGKVDAFAPQSGLLGPMGEQQTREMRPPPDYKVGGNFEECGAPQSMCVDINEPYVPNDNPA